MSETRDGMVTVEPTPDEAAWVLYRFGYSRVAGGRLPPPFFFELIAAMRAADAWNLERLSAGFPGLVTAHRWITTDLGGADRLKAIAWAKT